MDAYALEQTLADVFIFLTGWGFGVAILLESWFVSPFIGWFSFLLTIPIAGFVWTMATSWFYEEYDRILKLWGIRKWL